MDIEQAEQNLTDTAILKEALHLIKNHFFGETRGEEPKINIAQARNKVAVLEYDLEEANEQLQSGHRLVKTALAEAERLEAALEDANSVLQATIANEKTEDKIIDMSHFIGSGLMMAFWYCGNDSISYGYLQGILTSGVFRTSSDFLFKRCRPILNHDYALMTGWDKPPIPEGYVIEYKKFKSMQFTHYEPVYDKLDWSGVAMFRIVAIKDGFKHE